MLASGSRLGSANDLRRHRRRLVRSGISVSLGRGARRIGSAAYLRFALEDSLDPLAATCTFTVIVIVGLVLAADWLVIGCLRGVGRTIRTMWRAAVWGNDRVADGSEKVILGLGTAAKAVSHGATGLARVAKAAIPTVPGARPFRSRRIHPRRRTLRSGLRRTGEP